MAVEITMKELLEAGVHFGHQTRRWNPKMKEYIFGERNGIHIIDLQKTLKMFREASRFVSEISSHGRTVLFVGTKRQAQDAISEEAKRCGAFFINHRWLGGTLTNWSTLQKSIKRLKLLQAMTEDGRMEQLSKKERARLDREMKHLFQNLEGIVNMTQLPDAMFVVDSNAEEIGVKEARRMGIPVVSVVDTNCDPDMVDWIIPATMMPCALSVCSPPKSPTPLRKVARRTNSRRSPIKRRLRTRPQDGVEYVDTSAYEQYEKQEGDFIDPADIPAEPVVEPVEPAEAAAAAEIPHEAEAAK